MYKEEKDLEIEWTQTLEIDLDKQSKEEIKAIEFLKKKSPQKKEVNKDVFNNKINNMDGNPFYQPSMNTIEFEIVDNRLKAEMLFNNKISTMENVTQQSKLLFLNDLLKDNQLSIEEYNHLRDKIIEENDDDLI